MSDQDPDQHPKEKKETLSLGRPNEIGGDLSLTDLSEEQRQEIRQQHASEQVRLSAKAAELGIESLATKQAMDDMVTTASDATRDDTAITLTRTQEDSLGKTEIIMGNTDTARRGKLSRSQSGLKDYTLVYIIAAVVVILIVVAMLTGD